jgi:hypothetical protein
MGSAILNKSVACVTRTGLVLVRQFLQGLVRKIPISHRTVANDRCAAVWLFNGSKN